jgi:nitroimidazol reductase NimA-like FMN-containing flavoprotein (pyridoxamine 5'-phosphate oxidase superfamily)
MFRPSRKPQKEIGEAQAWAALERATYGVLSVNGLEGYPYAMPISHVPVQDAAGRALLFHGALSGHRLEALRANPRACFTVTVGPEEAPEDILPGTLGTHTSVLAFGEVREEPPERRKAALEALCRRYAPGRVEEAAAFIEKGGQVAILRMEIVHLSGKRLLVK